MEISHDVAAVLAEYPRRLRPLRVEALASAGGFSGAALWRVAAPAGLFCLRRWPPEHPSPDRLTYIHAVLRHVGGCGLAIVPVPRLTSQGRTFVQRNGRLWELAPWLPGQADYRQDPRPERLAAALQALARFHVAAACFPGLDAAPRPSPGLVERREFLDRLLRQEFAAIRLAVGRQPASPLVERARRLIDLFPKLATPIQSEMEAAVRSPLPLVPCLRDIWHDHVLFTGERVTGLVDFGALRPESVAGDVARLVGSLAGDDAAGWIGGIQAYQQVRPLGPAELRSLPAFDHSTVLLSGMNWLRWLFVEGRRFEKVAWVMARLDETLGRVERLASNGHASRRWSYLTRAIQGSCEHEIGQTGGPDGSGVRRRGRARGPQAGHVPG